MSRIGTWVALLALLATTPAVAEQPGAKEPAAPPGAREAEKSAAEQAFERAEQLKRTGDTHTRRGDSTSAREAYLKAAPLYIRAYEQARYPILIFNAAQVYRLAGQKRTALKLYISYLDMDPKSKHAPMAREIIRQLESELLPEVDDTDEIDKMDEVTEIEEEEIDDPHPAPQLGRMWYPWAALGAGATLALTGGFLQRQASDNYRLYDEEVSESCPMGCRGGELAAISDILNRARLQKHLAFGAYTMGGLAVAAGIVGLVLAYSGRPEKPSSSSSGSAAHLTLFPNLSGQAVGIGAALRFP